MTILELFKTKTAEEIAEEYVKEYRGPGTLDTVPLVIAFNGVSDCDDCPEVCEYYDEIYYEDYGEGLMCCLPDHEKCPYKINKDEVLKRNFIELLNMEIKEGNDNAK